MNTSITLERTEFVEELVGRIDNKFSIAVMMAAAESGGFESIMNSIFDAIEKTVGGEKLDNRPADCLVTATMVLVATFPWVATMADIHMDEESADNFKTTTREALMLLVTALAPLMEPIDPSLN